MSTITTNSRDLVADAWRAGRILTAGTITTDGRTIRSYDHVIGVTDGTAKIAYRCTFSVTTRQHVGAVRRVADLTVDICPGDHGRIAKRPFGKAA